MRLLGAGSMFAQVSKGCARPERLYGCTLRHPSLANLLCSIPVMAGKRDPDEVWNEASMRGLEAHIENRDDLGVECGPTGCRSAAASAPHELSKSEQSRRWRKTLTNGTLSLVYERSPPRPAYAPVPTYAVERPAASYSAKMSPRTRHAFVPSSSALLTSWAQATRVFHSAQPRPRAQAASPTDSRSRNA